MFGDISFVVIAAGLCSGAIVGAAISTETEQNVRRSKPWTLFSNFHWVGIILNQVFWLLIIGAGLTIVAICILYFGSAYPLSKFDRYTLGISLLFGAGLAKFIRYLYWKKHA